MGRAVRRVPRVPPWRFGKDRDLQVASTAIGTKRFAFPKAVRRAVREPSGCHSALRIPNSALN
jgi:hypothetical protein